MGTTNNFNLGGNVASFEAENAMTERYVVVEVGSAEGQCDLPSATSDLPLGVILETAEAGQAVPVQLDGLVQIVANGAVAMGALVYIAATTGRVDDSDTGTAVGLALTPASGAGELIVVDLSYKGAA